MIEILLFYSEKLANTNLILTEYEEITAELKENGEKISLLKINSEKNKNIFEKFNITATPLAIVLKKEQETERIIGYYPKNELRTKIKTAISQTPETKKA